MEMEDHHLRQLFNGKPINFQSINPHDNHNSTDLLFSLAGHRNLPPPQQLHHNHHPFVMMQMVGMHSGVHHEFPSDCTPTDPMAAIATVTSAASTLSPSCGFDGGDGGNGRWPRQETLTLLEIRCRLDPKFKEANQKGPLWDEVSRIMYEEHGYQRSGKKCREKFENLYKYYKKTKEGKAGRQDGKHYRFFRQLEALYGDNNTNDNDNNNNNGVSCQEITPLKLCESLSLSSSSKFETSSSDDTDMNTKKGWKSTIKDFIDSKIGNLMDRQEAWLVKLTKTLEEKEEERVLREEQWSKEEANRIDRERKFWAKERAWIEARDAALMEALDNLSSNQQLKATSSDSENHDSRYGWVECEVSKLIQLRTSMETRFQQGSEVLLWEEISAKMGSLGFEKSGLMCKEKWDSISANYTLMSTKKRKDINLRGFDYNYPHNQHNEQIFNQGNDGCFRFFMGADGENLWENYGLKLRN